LSLPPNFSDIIFGVSQKRKSGKMPEKVTAPCPKGQGFQYDARLDLLHNF